MAGVVVSALLLVTTLVACGGDDDQVSVHPFHVAAADRVGCEKLLAAVPDSLADQARRDVSGSPYAAAWGDPAIVLRCGVPLPKDFAGSPCVTRNGIGWSIPVEQADELDRDVTMTLAFRSPVIQLHVPATYRPNSPADVMADLDRAVRDRTTAHGKCR